MLHEFLSTNRQELIRRCQAKAAERFEPAIARDVVDHGAPLFLEQLAETLRLEHTDAGRETRATAKASPRILGDGGTDIGRSAALQGAELLRLGYNVEQVVHGYGDVCQAITGLAIEKTIDISTDEFRTLNRCLDNAIADAVTAFGRSGQVCVDAKAEDLSGRLAAFASEERRLVEIAMHSFAAIRSGSVGLNGATSNLLSHALEELHSLAERSLPETRATGATTAAAAAPPKKGAA